jgi:hypothetical protein
MKTLKTPLIGGLAIVGALALAAHIFAVIVACEREVLSRSVSPSGNYAAEHTRETCKGKTEVGLFVGPARPGVKGDYIGRTIFRAQSDRDQEYALSIKPFRIWWESEKKLHVEYPKQENFELGKQIAEVELDVQRTE